MPKLSASGIEVAKPMKAPVASAIAKTRAALTAKARERASKLPAWSRIEPLVRPAIAITLAKFKEPPPVGTSHIGGAPDMPASAKWPRTTRALEFVAQLRLEELAAFEDDMFLPRTGLLLLFADLASTSAGYLDDGAALLVTRLTDIARRPAPEGVSTLEESSVAYAATISLPPADGAFIAEAKLSAAERQTYTEAVLQPALESAKHQALGYPTLMKVESATPDEVCVLQLASDKKRKVELGDGQTLRFYMRKGKGGVVRVSGRDV